MSPARDAPFWTPDAMPDLTGRRALVTGVTSGLGEQTVLELARHGAEVIMAARNPAKLEKAVADIHAEVPEAPLHPLVIDVSDLSSVRYAAKRAAEHGPLHLLINNAGVMATPYERTADGLDLQMATNHFGPFALTGLLWPQLVESGDARVIAIGSLAHRLARRAPLEHPRLERKRHGRWRTYARSKLADLLFVLELDRRCREHGLPVRGLAAHPGYSATQLMGTGRNTGNTEKRVRRSAGVLQAVFELVGQRPKLGALPTLMAATANLPGSTYVGPSGRMQMRGHPRVVGMSRVARDRAAQGQLWRLSADATGVHFLDDVPR